MSTGIPPTLDPNLRLSDQKDHSISNNKQSSVKNAVTTQPQPLSSSCGDSRETRITAEREESHVKVADGSEDRGSVGPDTEGISVFINHNRTALPSPEDIDGMKTCNKQSYDDLVAGVKEELLTSHGKVSATWQNPIQPQQAVTPSPLLSEILGERVEWPSPSPLLLAKKGEHVDANCSNSEDCNLNKHNRNRGLEQTACCNLIPQQDCSAVAEEQSEQFKQDRMNIDSGDKAPKKIECPNDSPTAKTDLKLNEPVAHLYASTAPVKERKRRIRRLLAYHSSTYLLAFQKEYSSSMGTVRKWMRKSFFEMLSMMGEELKQYSSYNEMLDSLRRRLGQIQLDLRWFERPCKQEYLDEARRNYIETWDPVPTDEEWKAEAELLLFVSETFSRVLAKYRMGEEENEIAVCDAIVNRVCSEAVLASERTASPLYIRESS